MGLKAECWVPGYKDGGSIIPVLKGLISAKKLASKKRKELGWREWSQNQVEKDTSARQQRAAGLCTSYGKSIIYTTNLCARQSPCPPFAVEETNPENRRPNRGASSKP